jgi:hypothetical protein
MDFWYVFSGDGHSRLIFGKIFGKIFSGTLATTFRPLSI